MKLLNQVCLAALALGVMVCGLSGAAQAQPHKHKGVDIAAAIPDPALMNWSNGPSSNGSTPQATKPWLKLESIVKFPHGEMACRQLDDLQQAMGLAIDGQKTRMMTYFSPDPEKGVRCLMLSPGQKYKVIQAQANDANRPDALILEVIGANIKQADNGIFVMIIDRAMVEVVRFGATG